MTVLIITNKKNNKIATKSIEKFILLKKTYETSQKYNQIFSKKYSKILMHLAKDVFVLNVKTDIGIKTSLKNIPSLLYFFNKNSLLQFKQLIDIVCYDKPEKQSRFTLNYLLFSTQYNASLIVSAKTSELSSVPSVTKIYLSAFWLEREVWDLFGVFFEKNSKLSRILTDYGFTGHPLRRDFPLTGFKEVSYSYADHRIVSSKVELAQESRFFIN